MVYNVVSIWKLIHGLTKPTKWFVRPAKTQISLGIRQSDQSQRCSPETKLGPKLPIERQRRRWSDWVDAQADLSLRWAQKSFCWVCHEVAQNASSSSLYMQHIYISSHFFTFRTEPNMKSFSHAKNIVLGRDIYIQSLNWC